MLQNLLSPDGEKCAVQCDHGPTASVSPGSLLEIQNAWGAWKAPSVRPLTLDSSSGHDIRVLGLSPVSGAVLSGESASPSPPPSPSHVRSLSLSYKQILEKERRKDMQQCGMPGPTCWIRICILERTLEDVYAHGWKSTNVQKYCN